MVSGRRRIQKRARDAHMKKVRRRLVADVFGVEDVARRPGQSMRKQNDIDNVSFVNATVQNELSTPLTIIVFLFLASAPAEGVGRVS
jgi:hypothetical protein